MDTVWIYGQGSTRQGTECADEEKIANKSDDIFEADISEQQSTRFDRSAEDACAGTDIYYRKCARTIRECLDMGL